MPAEAFRRGGVEPEPDPRGRARRRVLLVRIGVDALALVHLGAVEHAGLRCATRAHRALVLGLRRRSSTTSTPTAGAIPASPAFPVDHLGRLRRRRCSGRRRAVRDHGCRGSLRDQRHPSAGRDVHAPRDPCDGGGAPSCARCQRGVQLPERLHARRHRLRARRPLPLWLGADPVRGHGLRAFPDFGNYVPATLVVEKQFEPSSDPGRFDLLVNGRVVVAAAGDGAGRASRVRPGAYTVSEVAAAGTDPANYQSTVECKVGTRRTRVRSGSVYADLALRSGQLAVALSATSDSARPRSRSTRWGLLARQPETPCGISCSSAIRATFRSGGFRGSCGSQLRRPPALVGKADPPGADATPRTLDPGDIWTYSCSKKTAAPEDCRPSVVTNTAVVRVKRADAP